jgi:hypothetical protein
LRFPNRLFDDVYRASQNLREALFQVVEAAKIIESGFREVWAESDGNVNVTSRRLVPGD